MQQQPGRDAESPAADPPDQDRRDQVQSGLHSVHREQASTQKPDQSQDVGIERSRVKGCRGEQPS